MKTINLFFDFEFTSLSPDAQPISLGIVSSLRQRVEPMGGVLGYESKMVETESKSFYAEFSDFQIERCDDWVKENVVSKLKYYPNKTLLRCSNEYDGNSWDGLNTTEEIKRGLKEYLSQFSNYNIQFVCDCGTWDWYWMLQLLAEWDMKYCCTDCGKEYKSDDECCPDCSGIKHKFNFGIIESFKTGLPKLPSNISPGPENLNDLIAIKKGISVREAFDIDRDELFYSLCDNKRTIPLPEITKKIIKSMVPDKHNSLSDAQVIKAIYEKLK